MPARKAAPKTSPSIRIDDLRHVLDSAEAAIQELQGFASVTQLLASVEVSDGVAINVTHVDNGTWVQVVWS